VSSFFEYQSLEGYFLQDDPKTDPSTFDYVRKPIGRCFPHLSHTTWFADAKAHTH
jgi:hypothetical protein